MKTFLNWLENEHDTTQTELGSTGSPEPSEVNNLERWVNMDSYHVIKNSVEKLNKLAAKLDMRPITLELKGRRTPDWPQVKFDKYIDEHGTEPIEILVKVDGETPKVGNHKFIATIKAVSDPNTGQVINQLSAVPGLTVPPEYRHGRQGQCDHCCTARDRNETFIVQDQRDGSYKIVGRNCLADFVRSDDLGAHLKWVELIDELRSGMEGGMWGGRRQAEVITPREMIKAAKAIIDKRGRFVRSTVSDQEEGRRTDEPTKSIALKLIQRNPYYRREDYQEWKKIEDLKAEFSNWTAISDSEVDAIMKWLRDEASKPDSSSFIHNAYVVSIKRELEPRGMDMGVAAAIPWSYKKATENIQRRESQPQEVAPTPTWTAGDKINIKKGKVVRTASTEGDYGTTYIYTIKDDAGHIYTWFTGNSSLEKDMEYKINGLTVRSVGPDSYNRNQITTKVKGSSGTKVFDLSVSQLPEGESAPLPYEKGYKVVMRGEPTLAKVKASQLKELEDRLVMGPGGWQARSNAKELIPLLVAKEWKKFAESKPEAGEKFRDKFGFSPSEFYEKVRSHFDTMEEFAAALRMVDDAAPTQRNESLQRLLRINWSRPWA